MKATITRAEKIRKDPFERRKTERRGIRKEKENGVVQAVGLAKSMNSIPKTNMI